MIEAKIDNFSRETVYVKIFSFSSALRYTELHSKCDTVATCVHRTPILNYDDLYYWHDSDYVTPHAMMRNF